MADNPLLFQGLYLVSLIVSLSFHEAAHAGVAALCGDNTARSKGRLTLNPLRHIDPVGSVILPLILVLSQSPFLFGWAKPVETNPANFKDPKLDPVKVALAGPASNILIACVVVIIAKVVFAFYGGPDDTPLIVFRFLYMTVLLNCILAAFNMLPFPPLDGHYLLLLVLPPRAQEFVHKAAPVGFVIAIISGYFMIGKLFPVLKRLIANSFGL